MERVLLNAESFLSLHLWLKKTLVSAQNLVFNGGYHGESTLRSIFIFDTAFRGMAMKPKDNIQQAVFPNVEPQQLR